jgi:actin-like ATPase involved in cell morphogenesis
MKYIVLFVCLIVVIAGTTATPNGDQLQNALNNMKNKVETIINNAIRGLINQEELTQIKQTCVNQFTDINTIEQIKSLRAQDLQLRAQKCIQISTEPITKKFSVFSHLNGSNSNLKSDKSLVMTLFGLFTLSILF